MNNYDEMLDLADTLGLTALMTWCHSRGPYSRVLTAHEGQAWRDQADAAIGELVDALAVYKKDDLDAVPLAEAVVRLEAENERLHVCGTCRYMNAEARVCDYIKTDSGGSIHVRVATQACADLPYIEPQWTPHWAAP